MVEPSVITSPAVRSPTEQTVGRPVQPFIEAPWWNHERAAAPDATALSHEIGEWLDDPFITNRVPAWRSPIPTNPYGCYTYLEVADPLVIPRRVPTTVVNGYHLSNLVYFSWFARQSPSIGLDGPTPCSRRTASTARARAAET